MSKNTHHGEAVIRKAFYRSLLTIVIAIVAAYAIYHFTRQPPVPEAVKQQAVDQMADVSSVFRSMDTVTERLKQTRLNLSKSIKSEKDKEQTEAAAAATPPEAPVEAQAEAAKTETPAEEPAEAQTEAGETESPTEEPAEAHAEAAETEEALTSESEAGESEATPTETEEEKK